MTKRFAVLIALAAMLLVATSGYAQKSGGQHQGGKKSSAKLDAKIDDLSKQLDLTDEQKTKVRPILQDESSKLHQLKADASVPDADRKAKSKEIRANSLQQIRSILTPEQQKKLDAMPQSHGKGGKKKAETK
jgi:Spy/CpxP family protein refolding chaperone